MNIDEWTDVIPQTGEDQRLYVPKLEPTDDPTAAKSLDAKAIFRALASWSTSVHCYLAEGRPWIRVRFDSVALPQQALGAGRAISNVIGTRPLVFNALRSSDALFVVDTEEFSDESDPNLPVTNYGAPLDEVIKAWESPSPNAT